MSPTTDTDRADAVRAATWYLTRRDQTPASARPDPEVDAAELVQALWARGWRRTVVQAAPPWMPTPPGQRADPDAVHRHAAEARAALTRQETQTDER
ncbi:hypothetical protein [Nocardiopsis synnemataformans]|uniref:hypothetical protein n=1 Tax=Nocardiopsis synnemataformans TaxID=61305 RepID=UPI003EBB2154